MPFDAWRETLATLHLWTQVVGKVRLARTPWLNHSWHVTLYVTTRGLTTSPMPYGSRSFAIDFDFVDHLLRITTDDGAVWQMPLEPQSVARFYRAVMAGLASLDLPVTIDETPNEIADAVPFGKDRSARQLRPRVCASLLARAAADGSGLQGLPNAIPRQEQSRAFFLGRLRSRGHPLLGPCRAATPRGRAESAGRGGAGSVFARGQQRGLLAGGRAGRVPGLLFLRLSGAGRISRCEGPSGRRVLSRATERVRAPYDAVRTAASPDGA